MLMEVQKRGIVIPVASTTIQRDCEAIGRLLRGEPLTAEERRRNEEARERQRAERAAIRERDEVTVLGVDLAAAVESRMGWPAGYVDHLAQSYCECGPERDDGWWFCSHAEDEFPGIGR